MYFSWRVGPWEDGVNYEYEANPPRGKKGEKGWIEGRDRRNGKSDRNRNR